MDPAKLDKMSGLYARLLHFCLRCARLILVTCADQQLGQLYELMQAIQMKKQEESDS